MKSIVEWKARTIADGKPVRDKTEIDNPNPSEAERIFTKQFNFNRFRNLKVIKIKGV